MKILVVDDDPDLLDVIAFALERAGYLVLKSGNAISALREFERELPDLVVLDINMPEVSGFELAETLRRTSNVPIVMLTVRNEEQDIVRALELGADDYLTKPFSPRVLVARIRALLRRTGIESDGVATAGRLRLDSERLTLADGTVLPLTPLELRLLQLLFANPGRTIATERILTQVWGVRGGGNRHLLKQLVHRLRQKIARAGSDPSFLRTTPHQGYRLEHGDERG